MSDPNKAKVPADPHAEAEPKEPKQEQQEEMKVDQVEERANPGYSLSG
jgi:hypothetical protein